MTTTSRNPLGAVCLAIAASLFAPAAAHGAVVITESIQVFSEQYSLDGQIFSRTISGSGDHGISGRFEGEITSGGTPTRTNLQFATAVGPGPLPSGSFDVLTYVDPGVRGPRNALVVLLLSVRSIVFSTDEPIQLALQGSSHLTRGSTVLGRPGSMRLEAQQSMLFSWANPNETGELATLDTTLDLGPGSYRLTFECDVISTERNANEPPSPTTVGFNMSYAIIPAPSTLLPLAAIPFLTSSRRRRASGR